MGQHRKRGPFTCGHCGKSYYTTRRAGEGESYCSRECAFAGMASAPWCKVTYSNCRCCGESFLARKRYKVCSERCKKEEARRAAHAYAIEQHKKRSKPVECMACGICFSRLYGNKSKCCSEECRVEVLSRCQRASKSLRRARQRSNGKNERFDPFDVFRRDKWRCMCCGVKTPKYKRGSQDDDSPELDHIIPLSKGGEHSKRNTQLLCRKCNLAKSDGSSYDQLLLVG